MMTLFKVPIQNSHPWCNECLLENCGISIYFKIWPGTTYTSQSNRTKYRFFGKDFMEILLLITVGGGENNE